MDESASVSVSRLEKLDFARRVAEQHLAQIQRWITAEQQRLDEQAEGDRRRPPAAGVGPGERHRDGPTARRPRRDL